MLPVIVVSGPTGSGKSDFAVSLARKIEGEIVNADSIQLYRGFDIGSAKPTAEEMSVVTHHLFSVLDADEPMSAGSYSVMARSCIEEISGRGKRPIVVGGAGLYIRALLSGLSETGEGSQGGSKLIEELETALRNSSTTEAEFRAAMHSELLRVDEESGKRLHPNDIVRIRRALRVKLATGKSIVDWHRLTAGGKSQGPGLRGLIFVLNPPRERLYERIERRVDMMMKLGLIREVETLRSRYYKNVNQSPVNELKPFRSIGYRHVLGFLEENERRNDTHQKSELRRQQMIAELKMDTRRFAKRQVTWWRHQAERLRWVNVSDTLPKDSSNGRESLERIVQSFFDDKCSEEKTPVQWILIDG